MNTILILGFIMTFALSGLVVYGVGYDKGYKIARQEGSSLATGQDGALLAASARYQATTVAVDVDQQVQLLARRVAVLQTRNIQLRRLLEKSGIPLPSPQAHLDPSEVQATEA